MVAPVNRPLQLSIDLGTLPQDVQDIKTQLDTQLDPTQPGVAQDLAALSSKIDLESDPTKAGLAGTLSNVDTNVTEILNVVTDPNKYFFSKRLECIRFDQLVDSLADNPQNRVLLARDLAAEGVTDLQTLAGISPSKLRGAIQTAVNSRAGKGVVPAGDELKFCKDRARLFIRIK